MDLPWRIELFGGLRVRRGEQVITRFRTQKTALLLAYLAYRPRRTHPRDVLIELLWPESEPEVGRHKLSVALSSLRSQLESGSTAPDAVFVADRLSLGLNPGAVETDVAEFEALIEQAAEASAPVEQARLLARAVDLCQGPLLDGYYEEWVVQEQRHWEELFFRTVRQLIGRLEEAGELEQALRSALRAVNVDPVREESHREVMRLYAALGQPAAAARQYRELGQILKQELGQAPGAAARELAGQIEQQGVQVFRPARSSSRLSLSTLMS